MVFQYPVLQSRQLKLMIVRETGHMFALSERDAALDEFDESLWTAVVDKATAYPDGRLVFTFRNGMEIEG